MVFCFALLGNTVLRADPKGGPNIALRSPFPKHYVHLA